jgi:hypothetical protein
MMLKTTVFFIFTAPSDKMPRSATSAFSYSSRKWFGNLDSAHHNHLEDCHHQTTQDVKEHPVTSGILTDSEQDCQVEDK